MTRITSSAGAGATSWRRAGDPSNETIEHDEQVVRATKAVSVAPHLLFT